MRIGGVRVGLFSEETADVCPPAQAGSGYGQSSCGCDVAYPLIGDGGTFPNRPADPDGPARNVFGSKQIFENPTGRTTGRKHSGDAGAEYVCHQRYVDPIPARVVLRFRTSQFARRNDTRRSCRDVESGIHCESIDLRHR